MDEFEPILDLIYEAALVPETWPRMLDAVAALTGCAGGLLFTSGASGFRWTASAALAPAVEAWIEAGWVERNTRAPRAAALDRAGFIYDFDIFTPEEIERDPMHAFSRDRLGLGWCHGTVIPSPTDDLVVFNWERRYADGPMAEPDVRRLDPLRPHLARAGLIAARLGLERAHGAAAALGLLGLPAAILSRGGRILAANTDLEAMIPSVLSDRGDRIRFVDRRADALLARILDEVPAAARSATSASIPLPGRDGRPPLVAHLVPVRGAAADVFAAGSFILLVTPLSSRTHPPAIGLLRGLFDLTAAEARVARGIAEGRTVGEIATAHGVSDGTVRVQLRSVFGKTGLSRQADLVAMLGGLVPIRTGPG